jgi:opacity protein-like surface antigen
MHSNKYIQTLFVFLSFSLASINAQTYIGAGYGTFNVPEAMDKFRGWGPTVKLAHVLDNEVVVAYLDLSRFTKKSNSGSVSLYDDAGNRIGSADTEKEYAYLYAQTGLKVLFFGRADNKKILPYAGGGIALVNAVTTTSYKSTIATIDDDKYKKFIFGFHISAGLRYNLQPVLLELRGNFDIDIKPLVDDSDVSNILRNLRLCALIPLSKG